MRLLLVGAGGVGAGGMGAAAGPAARRDRRDGFVVADHDLEPARAAVAGHEAKGLAAA